VSDTPSIISDKDARIAELEAALAAAKAELAHRDLLIETMRVQLARLRRMQFGASSEKLATQIAQLELALEELEAEVVAVQAPDAKQAAPERPAPVRSLPESLPREIVTVEPASGACACPECGGALRRLSDDSAEQLDVAPVQWRVVRTLRPKYSCRACEKIVQAPAPVKAVTRGKATFATLAHVITAKFDHHLPLYRQAEMMAAQGIAIDRSTLAGWAGQAASLLDPVVSRIREEGLKAAILAMTASIRRPISPTSSPKSQPTGQRRAGTISCHGTGNRHSPPNSPHNLRSPDYALMSVFNL